MHRKTGRWHAGVGGTAVLPAPLRHLRCAHLGRELIREAESAHCLLNSFVEVCDDLGGRRLLCGRGTGQQQADQEDSGAQHLGDVEEGEGAAAAAGGELLI